jgi:hypothetical protein
MKRLPALILSLFLLSAPAFAEVQSQDKTCQTDADCVIIPTACTSCCPMFDLAEVDAVTKGKEQSYADLGKCTDNHIKSCGVPECGLMPTPYPVAACTNGSCTVVMHSAPGQPDAPKGTIPQSAPKPQ